MFQTWYYHFKLIELIPQLNPVESYRTPCIIDYHVSCRPSCMSVIHQLSIRTMIYYILGFKSLSPTLLVAMSANLRPPSHQSIFCKFTYFVISHKMYSFIYVPYRLGILTILIHTHIRLSIQYNNRCFFWKYILILVQKFINEHPAMC